MRSLAVTSTAGTAYTAAQVQSLLFGPSLRMRWFFDLLDAGLNYKADLTGNIISSESTSAVADSRVVVSAQPPQIAHDYTQAVKRKLTFTMRAPKVFSGSGPGVNQLDTIGINVLRDLIRVRYQVQSPDGGWLEWVIGTFMFTPPNRVIQEGATFQECLTYWTVTAPDLSQLLSNETFEVSTSVTGGSTYTAGIAKFVGMVTATPLTVSILNPTPTLANGLSWTAGTDSALKAINDLLGAVVYTTAYMKGNAVTARPYPDFTQEPVALYLDTIAGQAKVMGPFGDTPDYSQAMFNVFRVTGQDPRNNPIWAEYVNDRADSPVSTYNLGQRYVKYINDSSITDNGTAQRRAQQEAQTAARIYSTFNVGLPPWPFFDDLDCVQLVYQSADDGGIVTQKYLVMNWVHYCTTAWATTVGMQRVVAA